VAAIRYLQGDASPQAKGPKIVAHLCNDLGGRGKGIVLAVSRCRPVPRVHARPASRPGGPVTVYDFHG
jgi:hypothetical protein